MDANHCRSPVHTPRGSREAPEYTHYLTKNRRSTHAHSPENLCRRISPIETLECAIHRRHGLSKFHPCSTMGSGVQRRTSEIQSRDRSPASHSRIYPPSNNFNKTPTKHTPNSCRTTHFPDSVPFCNVGSAMYNFCVSSRGRKPRSQLSIGNDNCRAINNG